MAKILGSLVLTLVLVSFALANDSDTAPVGPVADDIGLPALPGLDVITWTTGANTPTARYGAVSGWYNGQVFFSHGRISNSAPYNTNVCEAYNPTTNTWTTMAPAPTARRMVGAGKVQSGTYLHSVGGRFDATTTVGTYERYDMATNTWVTLAPCTPRWAHGAAALDDGTVYVFGGSDATVNTSVQKYTPATNTWSAVANLPAGRGWCAGAALNGLVYCIAGSGVNTMYEYNPATNTWATKAPLPANRFYHWAVADPSLGKIYSFGGATAAAPTPDVLVWDQATNTWTTETAMPGARNWPSVGGDGAGTFFVCGGFDGSAIYYNQTWIGSTGGPPPNMTITMTPVSPPIIIPATGGSFDFNVTITNNGTSSVPFQAWIMVTLPSGATWGPALGPVSLTLAGGGSITRLRTQSVPASAPAGNYSYVGHVGQYPSVDYDTDSFPFTKSADDQGGYVGEWSNSGESFESGAASTMPAQFALLGNYPNPFNPTTTINYALGNDDFVNLSVYDLSGRKVATIVDGWRTAGSHAVSFDASNLTSGVYMYTLTAGGSTTSAKMVLMK